MPLEKIWNVIMIDGLALLISHAVGLDVLVDCPKLDGNSLYLGYYRLALLQQIHSVENNWNFCVRNFASYCMLIIQ